MYKRIVAVVVSASLVVVNVGCGTAVRSAYAAAAQATPDQQAMDKLLAPVALYPDALLAQVLACAGSPQQVTEMNTWLTQNSQLQGTELQQAAETAGFDASFVAMVLFPDVLALLGQNMPWTTELGKAFTSDQKAVLDSVQRLRAQAKAAGNLKTTPQQEVKTETQSGQTVIVVQPANPQVVYVPQYNPQTVYTAPPPAPSNSGQVAAAAVIGFAAGIALGAAANNSYYGYHGWSTWGMHWHSHTVVVRGGAWHVPPHPRYPYARPVGAYRAPANVYAPRNSNVNVNVNNNVNVNRNVNTANVNRNVNTANVNSANRTPRPTTSSAATTANRGTAARPQTAPTASASQTASRGRAQSYSGASSAATTSSPARQMEKGEGTSAFSGYQSGGSERAASSRGRSSSSTSSSSGGSRRRR